MNLNITKEQYIGLLQLIDSEINRLERIITERAEQQKTTAVFGRSLAFYKRLKTKLVKEDESQWVRDDHIDPADFGLPRVN